MARVKAVMTKSLVTEGRRHKDNVELKDQKKDIYKVVFKLKKKKLHKLTLTDVAK